MPTDPAERIARLIRREGPVSVRRLRRGSALRRGWLLCRRAWCGSRTGRPHFITSPEVGPLFGAVVSEALDRWWDALEQPDPYLVVEAGAGRGRLASDVVRAEPRCLRRAPVRARRALAGSARRPAQPAAPRTGRRGLRTIRVVGGFRRAGSGARERSGHHESRRASRRRVRGDRRRQRAPRQPALRHRLLHRRRVGRSACRYRRLRAISSRSSYPRSPSTRPRSNG